MTDDELNYLQEVNHELNLLVNRVKAYAVKLRCNQCGMATSEVLGQTFCVVAGPDPDGPTYLITVDSRVATPQALTDLENACYRSDSQPLLDQVRRLIEENVR